MRSVPTGEAPLSNTLSSASARSSSTLPTCSTYAMPASVRLTFLGVRVKSAVPSEASSESIRRVTDEVATPRRWAAFEKPPASATSNNVFRARNLSMNGLNDGLVASYAKLDCILDSFSKLHATVKLPALPSERCNMQAILVEVNYDFICPWCWI